MKKRRIKNETDSNAKRAITTIAAIILLLFNITPRPTVDRTVNGLGSHVVETTTHWVGGDYISHIYPTLDAMEAACRAKNLEVRYHRYCMEYRTASCILHETGTAFRLFTLYDCYNHLQPGKEG